MVQHAIAADFAAILAAFRQSRLMRFTDENTKFLKRLLAPGQGVLGSVPDEAFAPPSLDDLKIDLDGPRLLTVLDRYYERYGHLCLASPFAIEAEVGGWIKRHGPDGVWDEVRTWSQDATRPLKKYHASRIFLRFPEGLVPHESRSSLDHMARFAGRAEGLRQRSTFRFAVGEALANGACPRNALSPVARDRFLRARRSEACRPGMVDGRAGNANGCRNCCI